MRPLRLALALALAASPLRGVLAEPPPASPLLPPGHWAVEAAERLEEAGLVERYMPAERATPLQVVARALAEGEVHARERRPELVPLVLAWRQRLAAEWSGVERLSRAPEEPLDSASGIPVGLLGARLALGARAGSAHEVGTAAPEAGPAALHLTAPSEDAYLALDGALSLGPHLAAGLEALATPFDATLDAGDLALAVGPLAAFAGRGRIAYGPGLLAGPVASGQASLDRVEVMTAEPLRLPLGLGDLSFDFALAKLGESARHPYAPLLLLGQVGWRPHPRLTFLGARGYMFGGRFWDGLSFSDALLGLSGLGNEAGNNVFSMALRYRLPTERLLPLTLKVDLGTDDNLGAMLSWPGLVAGLSAPLVPGLPLGLGVEVAHFGHGLDAFRHDPFPWYTHGQYTGGWASGEAPLGDPLGGNGDALRASLAADPWGGAVRLRAVGFLQRREPENLYAPQAGGRSAGLSGEAELRRGRFTVGLAGAYERGGAGWERRLARAWLGANL